MTVQIVEGPGYRTDGMGGIVLLGEWGRDVTIECEHCHSAKQFRLCADELLEDDKCDDLLNEHLRSLGWSMSVDFDDICPDCTKAGVV